MRSGRLPVSILFAAIVACASGGPRHFGQYADFAPQITAQKGERLPRHVTVQLSRAANVAVFFVTPGLPPKLLFPADSTQNQHLDAGTHPIETSLIKTQAPADSNLNLPRNVGNRRNAGMNGRNVMRDSSAMLGANDGFLLVYASEQPLPYSALISRVVTRSIPAEDQEALNTVAKLVREATRTTGAWAASAIEFP